MCVELMTVGALSGMGKTMEASVITIILTACRDSGRNSHGTERHLVGTDYFKYCKRNHFLCVLSSYHEEDEGIGAGWGKVQRPKFRGQKSKKYACKMSDFVRE